jgi:large subunit ribosomal protein L29
MPIGSAELRPENLDSLDNENLLSELRKAKAEMFNLRFQKATGQLETHGRIIAVRRDIARIETWLRERELGIRTEPVAPLVESSKAGKNSKTTSDATEAGESDAPTTGIGVTAKNLLSRFRKDKTDEAGTDASTKTASSKRGNTNKTGTDKIKAQKVVAAPKFTRQKKG